MRYGKTLMFLVPLLAIAACGDDDGVTTVGPPEPAASVRFINAVVDTGMVDLRFTDRVENLPTLMGVAFRGHSGMYQRVGSGNRETRVFPSSSDINLTSIRLVDQVTSLNANQRYTFVYAGRAAAGAPQAERHRLAVIEDVPLASLPVPAAGTIAIQALHTAVGVGNVDVHILPVDSIGAPTPADFQAARVGLLSNIPYLGKAASYVSLPVRPAPARNLYRFVVTRAGTTDILFVATPNQPGAAAPAVGSPGHGTVGAQPGVQISGSVMTAVLAPGATPQTRGAVATGAAANLTPTVFLIPDKVLNP
jgi:hypothetical protein